VGLSAGLLGETCVEGWAKTPFCPRLHDKAADLTKILLVRALLQDPTVLIAEQVADSWPHQEQAQFGAILRGFLDGTIDDCLPGAPSASELEDCPRTVIWFASPSTFERVFRTAVQPGDVLLTMHSSSVGTIGAADEQVDAVSAEPHARSLGHL